MTVLAIEKGHTAKERVQRGFGAPQPEGYRKALRLMRRLKNSTVRSSALSTHPARAATSARRSVGRARPSPNV